MKDIYTEAFGDTPNLRVLSFLIEGRELDYSLTDIARNSKLSRTTLYRVFSDLIKNDLVIPTRVIGKSKLYKINEENIIIKELSKIFDQLLLQNSKRVLNKIKN